MGRNRFVISLPKRIPLSDDDWIEVKTELNAGDFKRIEAAGQMTPILADDASMPLGKRILYPIDWSRYELERTEIWLLDWSFSQDGKNIPVTMDAIKRLDTDTFQEVSDAISKHSTEIAMAKKKLKDTELAKMILPLDSSNSDKTSGS